MPRLLNECPVYNKNRRQLAWQKRRDFLNAFEACRLQAKRAGLQLNTIELCKMAALQPAPRFYLEAKRAMKMYNLYKSGECCIRHEEKRKMFAEIFARYEKAMESVSENNKHRLSKTIMEKVLQQQAPSFYYDEDSAVKMYYRIMSDRRYYNI